jgi:hypothetical protein
VDSIDYNPTAHFQGWVYNIPNCGVRNGPEDFTFNNNVQGAALVIIEYSGCAAAAPADQTAQNKNAGSTSPSTGTTAMTTVNNEVCVAQVWQSGGDTFSAPTNNFTLVDQQKVGTVVATQGWLERIVANKGTYSTGVTSDNSAAWIGMIATFKP